MLDRYKIVVVVALVVAFALVVGDGVAGPGQIAPP